MADFQEQAGRFEDEGIRLAAVSVDDLDDAREMKERLSLTFPVGHGLDAPMFSELTGVFYEEEKGYLHAAAFLLDEEGVVASATYSTGPVGRLTPDDALAVIDAWRG